MRIERSLTNRGDALKLVITDRECGWQVREERGRATVRDVFHEDWHCVERDLMLFDLRAAVLRKEGWIETTPGGQQPAGVGSGEADDR